MQHIFLSYSSDDRDIAIIIEKQLEQNDYQVWLDQSDLRGGDDWEKSIVNALNNAWLLIVIASPKSNESRWVRSEVNLALDHKLPVVPILIKDEIPFFLRHLQYVDWRGRDIETAIFGDDFYEILLRQCPTPSLDRAIPFQPGDNKTDSERLQLVAMLRNIGANPRSPKAYVARGLLEQLAQEDPDELVEVAARKALSGFKRLGSSKSLQVVQKTIEDAADSANEWSSNTLISVRTMAIAGTLLIIGIALAGVMWTFLQGDPDTTPTIIDNPTPLPTNANIAPQIIIGSQVAPVYENPSDQSTRLDVARNVTLLVTGQTEDGDYLRIVFNGVDGWIKYTSNIELVGTLSTVPEIASRSTDIPMDTPEPTNTDMPTATMTVVPTNTSIPTDTPEPINPGLQDTNIIYTENFEDRSLTLWDEQWGSDNVRVVQDLFNSFYEFTGENQIALRGGNQRSDYTFEIDFRIDGASTVDDSIIAIKFLHDFDRREECGGDAYEILLHQGNLSAGLACGEPLGLSDITIMPEQWYTLRVIIEGNRVLWDIDYGVTHSFDLQPGRNNEGLLAIYGNPGANATIQLDNIVISQN